MRLFIILFVLLTTSSVKAQWVTFDPTNYIANYGTYLENIKKYTQMVKDAKEFVDQSKSLKKAFGENGMWEKTFKALADLRKYMEETKDVISIIQARDAYALIEHLPIDDDWKSNIYTVIEDTHGLLPDHQFNALVGVVADKNPVLSDFLIRSRGEGRAGLDHRLNSYYFVSSRKNTTDKRMEQLEKQRSKVTAFTDMSQGESMNMMNAQMLLMAQQNEEILRALNHQIVSEQDQYIENLKAQRKNIEAMIKYESKRRSMTLSDFMDDSDF